MNKLILINLFLMFPALALAVGPGTSQMTRYDVNLGGCSADSVTMKWNLDSIMGEPKVYGTYKWDGEFDCKPHYSTTFWLKVEYGSAYGYVRLSPVHVKAGDGWAYDTPGSPSWGSLVCGFSGTEKTDCYSASEAKEIWRNGSVTDFRVVSND